MFNFAKTLVKTFEQTVLNPDSVENLHKNQDNVPEFGFRVLHVEADSIAFKNGIESWFDFIIGINGHEFSTIVGSIPTKNDNENEQYGHGRGDSWATNAINYISDEQLFPDLEILKKEMENCKGREVSFDIWSSKGGIIRRILLPINEIKDENEHVNELHDISINSTESTIKSENLIKISSEFPNFGFGMSLQWTPLSSAEHIWHIINVVPNSPADKAGLIAHSDYIIGAQDGLLATGGETLLSRIISRIAEPDGYKKIELYVYNHDYDVTRSTVIEPNRNWGGDGLLGCGVGYGILHRLPEVIGKFKYTLNGNDNNVGDYNLAPGETLFNLNDSYEQNGIDNTYGQAQQQKQLESNYITPATMNIPSPPTIPTPQLANDGIGAQIAVPLSQQPVYAPHHKKKKVRARPDLNAYFQEESERSKKEDHLVRFDLPTDSKPPPSKPPTSGPPPKKQ